MVSGPISLWRIRRSSKKLEAKMSGAAGEAVVEIYLFEF